MSREKENWRQKVQEDIEIEGFHYALCHYDSYDWVPDQSFQELLKRYREVVRELEEYLGVQS